MLPPAALPSADWITLPPSLFKLNSDVAIRRETLMVGLGAVIRDDKGRVIMALSKPLAGNFSAEISELLAL